MSIGSVSLKGRRMYIGKNCVARVLVIVMVAAGLATISGQLLIRVIGRVKESM